MNVELYKIIYSKLCYKPYVYCISKTVIKDITSIKDKYNNIQKCIDSIFCSKDTEELLLDDLYKSNKVYFGFLKLYKILLLKKCDYFKYNDDLHLESLSLLSDSNKIQIIENNIIYNFKISDLINIINNALTNNNNYLTSTNTIKNPYTNTNLSYSSLFYIYTKIKHSNYNIPILFQLYYQCDFNSSVFFLNYEHMINDFNINNMTRGLNNDEILKYIRRMLRNKNKGLNIHINIDQDFPFPEKIINIFKKYLILYNKSLYHYNDNLRYSTTIYLNKKLYLFYINNKRFGRKILKKFNDNKYTSYFNDTYTPFEELDIHSLTRKQCKICIDEYYKEYIGEEDSEISDNDDLEDY